MLRLRRMIGKFFNERMLQKFGMAASAHDTPSDASSARVRFVERVLTSALKHLCTSFQPRPFPVNVQGTARVVSSCAKHDGILGLMPQGHRYEWRPILTPSTRRLSLHHQRACARGFYQDVRIVGPTFAGQGARKKIIGVFFDLKTRPYRPQPSGESRDLWLSNVIVREELPRDDPRHDAALIAED
jgi:hypothetical protein